METIEASEILARVVREHRARLISILSFQSGDLTSSEDALAEAVLSALTNWNANGIPASPEGWLLQTARYRMRDAFRKAHTHRVSEEKLQIAMEKEAEVGMIPDRRLELLFVCAHPAIDPAVRSPLMLQTVLGLDAMRIAGAFLTSPVAMGQRLVRAKTKIRDAGIPFQIPSAEDLPGRVASVLDTIYASFTIGWDVVEEEPDFSLSSESFHLARLVTDLLPEEPEAHGLLALVLHTEARRAARTGPEGEFVPLLDQDPSRWDPVLIEEAESHLRLAATFQSPGRYQWEAMIQSVHAARRFTGRVAWDVILRIYDILVQGSAGLGARIGQAVAMTEVGHASRGLEMLEALPEDRIRTHTPYWVARANALEKLGQNHEASKCWTRAIGLTTHPRFRAHLQVRRNAITPPAEM